jgi:hypothetical protein
MLPEGERSPRNESGGEAGVRETSSCPSPAPRPEVPTVVQFPRQSVLGSVVLTAALGGVVLAATMLGREFDQGTVRALLLRGIPSFGFLLPMSVACGSLAEAGESPAATIGLGSSRSTSRQGAKGQPDSGQVGGGSGR